MTDEIVINTMGRFSVVKILDRFGRPEYHLRNGAKMDVTFFSVHMALARMEQLAAKDKEREKDNLQNG